MNKAWKKLIVMAKKETILSIAVLLAICSMFFVIPDRKYMEYVDYRTLAILFSLMVVVAGLQKQEIFDRLAASIVGNISRLRALIMILIMLCFFFSMIITNDVALITFVPLAITSLNMLDKRVAEKWLIPVVVMQTVAANLGSMLTPIGNPQNLYLYGLSGMSITGFVKLTCPYVILAAVIILIWCFLNCGKKQNVRIDIKAERKNSSSDIRKIGMYLILFLFCVLTVARLIPYLVTLVIVVVVALIFDRDILKHVDYALLLTFAAFFIFIGNMGRVGAFANMLEQVISGHEVITAVLASQAISNVPAALLLSGFTPCVDSLVIGTNLGGLGTMIASMASLISFKYIARENRELKGKYFIYFTVVNVIVLAVMVGIHFFILT